jgi:hypothetical protein
MRNKTGTVRQHLATGLGGMSERISFAALLLGGFLVFAELLSWVTATWPGPCIVSSDQDVRSEDAQISCPTFFVGSLIILKRADGLISRHDKSIVAVFTVVLAFSTIGLWISTNRLWEAGEHQLTHLRETADRQLRAYIYIEKTNFEHTVTGDWKIGFRIKNFGQTPAHNVKLTSIVSAVDRNGGNPEIPIPVNVESLGSFAPGGDFLEFEESPNGIVTLAEINEGQKAIFLTGEITYDGVLDSVRRVTNFRYYIGGDVGCDRGRTGENEMFAAAEGNDAT